MSVTDLAGAPVRLSLAGVRRLGLVALGTVMLCGLGVELRTGLTGSEVPLRGFFSLSYEGNLPTWLSTALLLSCALALALIGEGKAAARDRFAGHWLGRAAVFAYLSLDEFVSIHEHMNTWFDFGGFLYFGWVLPAGAAFGLLGLAYLRFLGHLPAPVRRRVCLAAALYVGGALGVELVLGWWTDRAGDENLGYALIDFVEESCEMLGAALFLDTLLHYLAAGAGAVVLQGATRPEAEADEPGEESRAA